MNEANQQITKLWEQIKDIVADETGGEVGLSDESCHKICQAVSRHIAARRKDNGDDA